MKIATFGVEMWMNEFENHCRYNLAETCVDSITLGELIDMAGVDNSVLG
ncbi:MAG TPA: aminotransferase, partial [Sulfitobacter sp.]|nr:aminotransferase [Sulfitobacter sp.]